MHGLTTDGAKQEISTVFMGLRLVSTRAFKGLNIFQLLTHGSQSGPQPGAEKAIVTHLDEPLRQHMLQKTADEFFC